MVKHPQNAIKISLGTCYIRVQRFYYLKVCRNIKKKSKEERVIPLAAH